MFSSPFLLCCSFFCRSLPTTSLHVPNVRQMCSFCRLLIFLEVVVTADVPVSVFSFISLQFCYKIGTVRMLLPFRFSKKNLFTIFTVLFPLQGKLPPHTLWLQMYFIRRVCLIVCLLFFFSICISTSRCLSL